MNKQSYHHGNLKQALIERTLTMLQSQSVEQLSLRQIALQEKVTPTAVYKHFANKNELLKAVIIEGFRKFNQHVFSQSIKDLSAREKISYFSWQYFEFALQNSALFTLMFQFHLLDEETQSPCDDFLQATQITENAFTEALKHAVAEEGLTVNDEIIQTAAISAFATAHGLTDLYRNGTLQMMGKFSSCVIEEIDFSDGAQRRRYLESMSELFIEGIISQTRRLAN